jgi:protein O-mannosyl-transferase
VQNGRETKIVITRLKQNKNLLLALVCASLAILTSAAFWPAKDCGFVNYDDNIYVYENPYVQSGLSPKSAGQVFSLELMKKSGNWHPLTWLSLMLDYSIFGLKPFGYHLINLLFHVLNTVLLFLILHRMTKTLWPGALIAALFAVHPLHVESVVWIAERKDVLSTFLGMLTMGAYIYYVEQRNFRRYFFVLLFFTLGLTAKPMLVTLPFVLLLLDFWPLGRFTEVKPAQKVRMETLNPPPRDRKKKKAKQNDALIDAPGNLPDRVYKWSLLYPLVREKIPLFVLSVLSCIVTFIAQRAGGAVLSMETLPPGVRLGNALVSYVAYIWKMILPVNLAVFYPHTLVPWQAIVSAVLLITVTAAVLYSFRKSPHLVTGWLWYLGSLIPVIGLVQVGSQAMADRYTYTPLIGLFIMAVFGIGYLLPEKSPRKTVIIAAVAILLIFASLTWRQCGYWRDGIALFTHTLQATHDNYLAHDSLGVALDADGRGLEAIAHYRSAIEINPRYWNAHYNLGNTYKEQGDMDKAFEHFREVIRLKPDFADAQNNVGIILELYYKKNTEAIGHYRHALEIEPGNANFHFNLGMALMNEGKTDEAIDHFQRAIDLDPGLATARQALQMATSKSSGFKEQK